MKRERNQCDKKEKERVRETGTNEKVNDHNEREGVLTRKPIEISIREI